jgi:bleomycin hydrolase
MSLNYKSFSTNVTPMMNAIRNNKLSSLSLNTTNVVENPYLFNNVVKPELPITNQRSSGRCWLFATLNIVRNVAYNTLLKKHETKLDNLEFSQSYVFFWDKLERYHMNLKYYTMMLEEKQKDEYLRTFWNDPMGDGGQWDMAKAIVLKYGVVPKSVFPDSAHAKSSYGMNLMLTRQLKNDCLELTNVSEESRATLISSMMKRVYRMLVSFLGEPPKPDTKFNWTFKNKDKVVTWTKTPLSLLEMIEFNPNDYVSIIHDPRQENPYYRKYNVKYLGNVHTDGVGWINLPIERVKELTQTSIKDNDPVWFGCDVGTESDRASGIHHPGIMDFNNVVGLNFTLNKEQRLKTFLSLPNHAMVINGFHCEEKKVMRWKIENSWGNDSGHKGYLLMTDKWFDEYVFQIVVNRKYMTSKELELLDSEPLTIEPWDPLGTLA